jgi:hypothetical protein
MQSVLKDEGWNVIADTALAPVLGTTSRTYTIEKEGKAGSVVVYHFANETALTSTEASSSFSGGVCKRSGMTLLCVDVADEPRATKELLAAITR